MKESGNGKQQIPAGLPRRAGATEIVSSGRNALRETGEGWGVDLIIMNALWSSKEEKI